VALGAAEVRTARDPWPARLSRRAFLGAAGVGLVAAPIVVGAQGPAKVPRLCFLTFDSRMTAPTGQSASRASPVQFDPFFQRLQELGYAEGQTITIDYLSADGHGERFPALTAECLRRQPDIVVVTTTPAAQAAQSATRTVPIVMLPLGDPVGTGLVTSLARPGGNITGLTVMAPGLAAKRLELLKTTVPRLSRVLVLSYLIDPIAPPQVKELELAAQFLGVKLLVQAVGTADDLPAAFEAGAKAHAEGLLTTAESIFPAQRRRVVELAARHRLPALYPYRAMVDAGGLMAYDSYTPSLVAQAATYVDKVLKGAKPADLPVEQPTKFELVVNLKTAKVLGLTVPRSLLARADQIIER
jgi:putative ABC transport system substrate-binding protein